MIAVIETGGKQYLVKNGQTLNVEKLPGEKGGELTFEKVLLTANDDGTNVQVGTPGLSGVTVRAMIEEQGRTKKIRVVKYKRKVRYRRVHGHRQAFTKVKIA
ncbi:MAG TPA: 50S ribosomal protein L21 [Candidatus Kapabacteria bacterium]|nr:50S ribosomal protein L21 [Candidatus Kapabacteria bacterium]